MSDLDKVKKLISSNRENQVIAIQLLINTLGYSVEDAALFYFFNKKPKSFFIFKSATIKIWTQSFWEVGFIDVRFSRSEGVYLTTMKQILDEECNYRCSLHDKPKSNLDIMTFGGDEIFHEFHSMRGNPPVSKFFSLAIELNL